MRKYLTLKFTDQQDSNLLQQTGNTQNLENTCLSQFQVEDNHCDLTAILGVSKTALYCLPLNYIVNQIIREKMQRS